MSTPVTIQREVAKVVADILQEEMDLDDAHCLLGDQKWDIPADRLLFVAIYDKAGPPVGASNFLDTDPDSTTVNKEIQQSVAVHDVLIEIMSFDNEARTRKEEVGLALASIYSQQIQGQYQLQIGRAQRPVDASETEVTGRLLKFVIHVNVTALHQKIKTPPGAGYYDEFNGATTPGTANKPEVQLQ